MNVEEFIKCQEGLKSNLAVIRTTKERVELLYFQVNGDDGATFEEKLKFAQEYLL